MSVRAGQRGLSLIELITAMVLLGLALGGILLAINGSVGHSADPMVQEQASALAQAYLEEVTAKQFCDPDYSGTCSTACTVSACGACAGAIGPAETRATYDDMCDYNGLQDVGARDQFNNAIVSLGRYTVTVAVASTGESLNGLNSDNGSIVRVAVTVTHPALPAPVVVSTYRANF